MTATSDCVLELDWTEPGPLLGEPSLSKRPGRLWGTARISWYGSWLL